MTKKTQERLRKLHNLFLFIFFITFALQLIGLFILLFITQVRIVNADVGVDTGVVKSIKNAVTGNNVTFTPQVSIPGSEDFINYEDCKKKGAEKSQKRIVKKNAQ